MAEFSEILDTINTHSTELVTLVEATRSGDEASILAAISTLLSRMLRDLPLVGALLDPALREAFNRSAYGQVQRALAELAEERDEQARREAIAGAVAGELREALALIIGQLAAVRQELDARRERAQIHIEQRRVEDGTGVAIDGRVEQNVAIKQGTIAGGEGVRIG